MNFNKDGFLVLQEVISKDVANFCTSYLYLRRKITNTFVNTGYISNLNHSYGVWNDKQVPGTFSVYADPAMEVLLQICKPLLENISEKKLYENYSYCRIYKKGDILKKHTDRIECEISTTLNLGGDLWPIFLKNKKNKKIKVNLAPGDMLIYKGCELEHWREKFKGENCVQVFLHYNDVNTPGSADRKYDTRNHLGLPGEYKKGEYFNP